MTDYTKLVAAVRDTDFGDTCVYCEHSDMCKDADCIILQAAAAIEELQAEVGQWKAAVKGQEDGIKVLQAEVERLEEAENSVERWKDMYLTKHEPKRVEFEKSLHEMFDSIWDCDINHPIFQDTVGELMEAVLQAYDTVNRAKMEVHG